MPQPTRRQFGGTAYWMIRPQASTTLVLLHGFRGSHRGLLETAEHLTPYRVILPDLPGWGESQPLTEPHTFPSYVRWLHQFLATFKQSRVILGGHSYGATMALCYAADDGAMIERAVLIEPVVDATTFTNKLGRWYYQVARQLPNTFRDPLLRSAILNRLTSEIMIVTADAERKRRIVIDEQKNLNYIRIPVELEAFQSFYEYDFIAAARRIHKPVTIIGGSRDQMTTVSRLRSFAKNIPDVTVDCIPGAGHFSPMEIPELLAQRIMKAIAND